MNNSIAAFASSHAMVSVDTAKILMLGNVQISFIRPSDPTTESVMVRVEFQLPQAQSRLLEVLEQLPPHHPKQVGKIALSDLEITEVSVKFVDLNLEIDFCPQELVFYTIFLLHSKEGGLKLKDLKIEKIQTELRNIYGKLRPVMEIDDVKLCINKLIDPNSNRIYELISTINKKLKKALPEHLHTYYCVSGERSEEKIVLAAKDISIKTCASFKVPF